MLLLFAITIISTSNYGTIQSQLGVHASPFLKGVAFHVAIINGLSSDTLDVHCNGDSRDLGLQHLSVNTNFTWDFKTAYFYSASYDCNLKWVEGQNKFNVFKDDGKFIDDECGGRHCFWKATDFGIYLYHIQKQQFVFKFGWGKNNMNGSSNCVIV